MSARLLLAVALVAPGASAATVRVRAATAFHDVRLERAGAHLRLTGALNDDGGHPVARAPFNIDARKGGGVAACPGADAVAPFGPLWRSTTSALGTFCLRVDHGRALSLLYAGTPYHHGASVAVPLDGALARVAVGFASRFLELRLDHDQHRIRVSSHPGVPAPPENQLLPLSLELTELGDPARPIGVPQRARAGEAVVFELDSTELGAPGFATLTVRYPGDTLVASATDSVVVQKLAPVALTLPSPPTPGIAERGIALRVIAHSRAGTVRSGWVEATLDGASVGNGAVTEGIASLRVRFRATRRDAQDISLRYVAQDPWWLPGNALRVTVPLTPPSPWRRLPWVLGALATGYVVIRAWRRPARAQHPRTRDADSDLRGVAGLTVVAAAPPAAGWHGVVRDAHDGTPIAGATVTLTVPSFTDSPPELRSFTNARGEFQLVGVEMAAAQGLTLTVRAPHHRDLTHPNPNCGHVSIALLSRRRALLRELVDWTRRIGSPYGTAAEPTPGEVQRVAVGRGAASVATWANEVERAAYGAVPPDAEHDALLQKQRPRRKRGDQPR